LSAKDVKDAKESKPACEWFNENDWLCSQPAFAFFASFADKKALHEVAPGSVREWVPMPP